MTNKYMKTIYLCPRGRRRLNIRLPGFVYALECQGVKAGFLKPFSQELTTGADRTTALLPPCFEK